MSTKLLLNPEYDLYERGGKVFAGSRDVAREFGKRHDHVIRDVAQITAPKSGVSAEFTALNFEASSYRDSSGKRNPEYLMTKDGFTILTFGYGGKKAMAFKEAYIRRFNEMEQFILSLHTAKLEHPDFTNAIMMAHDEPKHYHFSNETDMINRIVLGMSAKKFREEHGLPSGQSIRPFLTAYQIKAVAALQRADIGLIYMIHDFNERKAKLEAYFRQIQNSRLLLTA